VPVSKLIDGSGWGETWHGSGVYIHTNNVDEGGGYSNRSVREVQVLEAPGAAFCRRSRLHGD